MTTQPTTQSLDRSTAPPTRKGLLRWRPDQQWEGYLFLLPSFIGFLIFVAIPVVVSLLLSFVNWNLLRPPEFAGIANYVQLLTRDPVFWKVLRNTLFYVVATVPLQLAHRAGAGAGAEPGHPWRAGLSRHLFHAGGHDDRRRRDRVSVHAEPRLRADQQHDLEAGRGDGSADSAAGFPEQHALVEAGGGDVDAVEEHGLHHGDLSGCAAGRAAGAVRRRGGGRRRLRGSASET